MKIRTGFVSNSSSSSFCLQKKHMVKEQIDKFREALYWINNEAYRSEIEENKYSFDGQVNKWGTTIKDYLLKIGIKEEHIEIGNDWVD